MGSQSRSGACKSPSGGGLVLRYWTGQHERVVLHHPSSLPLPAAQLLHAFNFLSLRFPGWLRLTTTHLEGLASFFLLFNSSHSPFSFSFVPIHLSRSHPAPHGNPNRDQRPGRRSTPIRPCLCSCAQTDSQTPMELGLMPQDQHEPIQSIPDETYRVYVTRTGDAQNGNDDTQTTKH